MMGPIGVWLGKLDDPKKAPALSTLTSRPSAGHPRYTETFAVVALFGLIVLLLNRPAFDGFFMAEDFNWTTLYLAANGNFIRAIFSPILDVFFRPASIAWVLGTQLILPWNPLIHHIRNYVFTLINLFLLYRIMLRVTASRVARVIGMAFFALSKVHLTSIGLINVLEVIVTLMHFLLTLLFLIRYLQERRRLDYILAIVFFVPSVFSRDYSFVLISVIFVLFFVYGYENRAKHGSWRGAAIRVLPFLCVACGYLLVRISIVGLPKSGGDAPYAINLNVLRIAKDAAIFAGNLLNLSLSSGLGGGDLSTLLSRTASINRGYQIGLLVLGSSLLAWTIVRGILHRKWSFFSLLWAVVLIAPTFLIGNNQMYYVYEPVAAIALLLSMSLDFSVPGRQGTVFIWTIGLLIIGLNGYANSLNISANTWRWVADITSRMNQAIFVPSRGLRIRSLTIVIPSQEQAQFVQYLIEPMPGNQEAMLRALMNPAKVDFRIVTAQDYALVDKLSQTRLDLVYLFSPNDNSFTRMLPIHAGRCISFEDKVVALRTVWILNTQTSYDLNANPLYVSDGRQSIRVSVVAEGMADNHFGGIELPLPPTNAFSLDLWVDRPQDIRTIYAYEMDDQGHAIYAWINNRPGDSLLADKQTTLQFQKGSANIQGFEWNPQNYNGSPRALDLFVDVKEGKEIRYYVDRLCALGAAR